MKQFQSLDDLIGPKAVEFAAQMKRTAAVADKEEEIRIAAERQLAFIEKEAGVKLEGRHEFTVASGRVDSVYSRVIIEYKNPHGPDCIGPKPDSPGTKKVVEQIKKRFYDLRNEHGQPLNSLFGVGLDGKHFVFIRFRDDKWQVQDPVEVNKVSAERFLWALFNLGQKGKPFSPDYLAGDFGSGAKLAQDGIHALYEAIATATHPKAIVFFSQWKILFGEVCGYDVDNPSDKIKKLAEFYGVPLKGLKPAELLFAVHTYYALFMKLLASEIVGFFHKLPRPLQRMMQATTSAKLKREMEELEAGSIFRHLNITNFLEGDLFAWYIPVWAEPVEEVVRKMVVKLDQYNPGTLSEDPPTSRDLLKKLYQQLFPKSVRHDLGEYYTPDWLAEHVLNELGYVGDPDKRILDPACGSGTFLVMAINRIRQWYDKNREKCAFGEDDLCRKILANVIGFDLNPLAVMTARTNYLIAIRDLIGRVDKVEIPIYLCDSILTPSTYGGLFAGAVGKVKELKTAAAKFLIPTEIATNRDDVAKYAEQLEFCVKNGYSPKEFIQRCQEEGLPVTAQNIHADLYSELVKLDKANKNGVWARIIKNAFAPLFVGKVDYVAGNPPWVNWEHLPSDYKATTEHLWAHYGLFSHTGLKARLGTAKDDISILMTYVSTDVYLSTNGRLGFVITQSVFKTVGGGAGFRRFALPDGEPLGVQGVHDMVDLQPFEGATNRTATFVLRKGTRTKYPIRYVQWQTKTATEFDASLDEVHSATVREQLQAAPIDGHDPTSPWTTVAANLSGTLDKIVGTSPYKARAGVCGWLNGVFWVSRLREVGEKALIRNLGAGGKKTVEEIEASVEKDHLYPLLRGRGISRWRAECEYSIILPVIPGDESKALSEPTLRTKYPGTYQYLNHFRDFLVQRSGYRKYLAHQPFYAQYNVGPYTFKKYKVVWLRISNDLTAAVAAGVVPDNGVTFVPFESQQEAHYFCAVMNSLPIRWAIARFSVAGTGTWGSPQILTRLAIPRFNEEMVVHQQLAEASVHCHAHADEGEGVLAKCESKVDGLAAELWSLTENELSSIRDAFSAISRGKGRAGKRRTVAGDDTDGA